MKKLRLIIASLLPVLLLLTLLTGSASAALQSVGPVDPVTTIPVYYMDTTGVALMPCLDQNNMCILPPPFDPAFPPTSTITTLGPITGANLPAESFYYSADAIMNIEGGEVAKLSFVLEYAFLTGVSPNTAITFLRTDLQKMRRLAANSTYRVTHPYGIFTFSTDGIGDTAAGGGVAIRQEDQAGTAALWLPAGMQAATITNMGPFLKPAIGPLPTRVVAGQTHTYLSDPAVAITVTGSPNNTNFFRVERLDANGVPVGAGATWETNLFFLAGRVFTGQIPSPMIIDRVTYARDNATTAQVDVFASALPAALLSISGTTGLASTSIPQGFPNTGKFFVDIPVGALPTGVSITNSLDNPSILYPVAMVDEVIISKSFYNPVTRNLTIKADSRDNLAPLPSLTITAFGATSTLDATGMVVVPAPANAIPPLTVTVNSSRGGAATALVSVVTPPPAPVAVDDAATTVDVTPVTIAVLANDTTTATFDLATLAIVAPSANGTSVVGSGGTITFTPTAGYSGATTFTYDIMDNFGQVSNTATVTVTVTGTLAAAPWTFVAATNTTGTVAVEWSASAVAGVTYILEESTDALFNISSQVYIGTATTVSLPGHLNGTYYYRVKVTKVGYNDSAWKAAPNGCVVTVNLAAPAFTFVAATNTTGNIAVAWGASAAAGVTYILEESTSAVFTTSTQVYSGTATTVSLPGHLPGTYYYRAKVTKAGNTDSSWTAAPNGCVVSVNLAAAPWTFVAGTNTTGTVAVAWGASAVAGVTYILEESTSAVFTTSTQVYSGTATTVSLPGHLNGTYYYRVKVTKAGNIDSAWSVAANGCTVTVTLAASPWTFVQPTNTTGTVGVAWGASAAAGVTYILEESTSAAFTISSQVYSGTATTVSLPGHLNGTYYYRVKVTKAGNIDSAWTAAANGCTVTVP